jgi:hypothetical protein
VGCIISPDKLVFSARILFSSCTPCFLSTVCNMAFLRSVYRCRRTRSGVDMYRDGYFKVPVVSILRICCVLVHSPMSLLHPDVD